MSRYRDQDPRQDAYNGDTKMDSPSGGAAVATFLVACFGCRQTFDAFQASWCSCLVSRRSLTCPHCAHFDTQILPEIKKKWIDTGKVKLVYRDFPLDQIAAKAAQIAECAGKDRYFGVIDLIFAGQQTWATAADPIAELAKPLRIAGLGENEIKACLANEAMSNAVISDYKTGEALGVNSTPTLIINGQLYPGARSVEELDGLFGKLVK